MNDLDQKIRDALKNSAEGDALSHEPNMAEELISAFRTRHRFVHGLGFIFTFVFFWLSVWAGYRFFHAATMTEGLRWGGLCLLGMQFVGFLKTYFWLEMNTNRILRELKRVELLVLRQQKD